MFGIFGPFDQERDRKQREIKDAGLGLLKSVQAIPGLAARGGGRHMASMLRDAGDDL